MCLLQSFCVPVAELYYRGNHCDNDEEIDNKNKKEHKFIGHKIQSSIKHDFQVIHVILHYFFDSLVVDSLNVREKIEEEEEDKVETQSHQNTDHPVVVGQDESLNSQLKGVYQYEGQHVKGNHRFVGVEIADGDSDCHEQEESDCSQ